MFLSQKNVAVLIERGGERKGYINKLLYKALIKQKKVRNNNGPRNFIFYFFYNMWTHELVDIELSIIVVHRFTKAHQHKEQRKIRKIPRKIQEDLWIIKFKEVENGKISTVKRI